MANDIMSLLGGMKRPTATESFAQGLLGYQRPSLSMEPMAQNMLGYQPSSMEMNPLARTVQPSMMDRVSSGLGGIGSAFTGPGSNARLQALAASLLTGPSRTPISFGSQLAKGLLLGSQAAQEEQDRLLKRGLLEREMELRGGELELAKEKLDVERQQLEGTGLVLSGIDTFYDPNGKPVPLKKMKDSRGGLVYLNMNDQAADLTNLTTDKPSDSSAPLGTLFSYMDGDGKKQTILNTDPTFGEIANRYADTISKVGTEQSDPVEKSYIIYESVNDPTITKGTWFKPGQGRIFEDGTPVNEKEWRQAPEVKPTFDNIQKGLDAVMEDISAMNSLSAYAQNIKGSDFGIKGKFNDFAADLISIFGNPKDLSPEQISKRIAGGRLQGLVGLFKEQVVGAGVMTEQDALRVIEYLGGNVGDWTANPVIIGEAIEYAMRERSRLAKRKLSTYNSMSKRSEFHDTIETDAFEYTPYYLAPALWIAQDGTQNGWRSLSDKEKAVFLGDM